MKMDERPRTELEPSATGYRILDFGASGRHEEYNKEAGGGISASDREGICYIDSGSRRESMGE